MKVCVHLFTSILLTLLSFGPHRSQSVQTRTADFRKTDKRKVNFHNHEGGGGSLAFGDSEETTFLPFSAQKQTFISRSAPVTHPGWWCAVCSAVSEELLTSGKDLNVFGSWGWELGMGVEVGELVWLFKRGGYCSLSGMSATPTKASKTNIP